MRAFLMCSVIGTMLLYHIILLHQANRESGVNSHSAILFTMIVYVDIVPLLIYGGFADGVKGAYARILRIVHRCTWQEFALAELCIFAFTSIYELGYRSAYNRETLSIYRFDEDKMKDALFAFSWMTLLIGGGAFLLYIRAFGGISSLLSYAEYFRSFRTNNSSIIGRAAVRLVVPSRMILAAPILLLTYMKLAKPRALLYVPSLIISLLLSAVFLLFNAGKTNLVLMLLCFALPVLARRFRHPWFIALTAGCLSIPLIGALDSLFSYIAHGKWHGFSTHAAAYIGQFAYVFANLLNLDRMIRLHGFRYGLDFITGPLAIVPGIHFPPSYEVSSEAVYGTNWKHIGGVPDDAITFGYLQLGLLGVIAVGMLLGRVTGMLDRMIRQMDHETYGVLITTVILSTYAYLINADLSVLVKGQFQLTICSLCILYSFYDPMNLHKRIKLVFGRR